MHKTEKYLEDKGIEWMSYRQDEKIWHLDSVREILEYYRGKKETMERSVKNPNKLFLDYKCYEAGYMRVVDPIKFRKAIGEKPLLADVPDFLLNGVDFYIDGSLKIDLMNIMSVFHFEKLMRSPEKKVKNLIEKVQPGYKIKSIFDKKSASDQLYKQLKEHFALVIEEIETSRLNEDLIQDLLPLAEEDSKVLSGKN